MRARNVKPGFFKNEYLAECDPLARILFEGLWCLADREGRLELRPKRIKTEVLPYDDCDIDVLITQLAGHGFIVLYSCNGSNYISIPNFTKHQNCHVKEAQSTIPAPDSHGASMEVATLNPESLLLNPESPNPTMPKPDKTIRLSKNPPDEFLIFWREYPNKVGKQAALKAWKKMKPPIERVIPAIKRQARSDQWIKDNGQFIPHPATWINAGRWDDEPIEINRGSPTIPPEFKLPECDRCGERSELVEHRGMNVCGKCLRILDPEIDSRIAELLKQVGGRMP